MRLAEFHQLVSDEFGSANGRFYLSSHVLSDLGDTPENLIESGHDLREVWLGLCQDFGVPVERQLGRDI